MKKSITFGAITAIAIGVAVAFSIVFKDHDETADMTPEFTVSCDDIVQEFLDDQEGATTKYVDKVVQVSGPIFEINKNEGQISGVKISTDEFYIVNCSFQEPISETELQNENIVVKGIVSGFIGDSESMLPGGTVELKRTAIVE